MKRNLLTIVCCLCALLSVNSGWAQSSLIYYWNFNNTAPAATDSLKPFKNGGSSAAHFIYHCAYIDYSTGSSLNLQPGDTAGSCIRFRNPSDSVVFFMPSNGYKNLKFSFAVLRTNNGSQTNVVRYSTDGVTYNLMSGADAAPADSCTYTVDTNSSFAVHSFDLSGDAATQNNGSLYVSIAFTNGNANPSGNDRFDNVTLTGVPLPGLQVISQSSATPSYTLYPNPVSNTLHITASAEGEKTVYITNMLGQQVYKASVNTENTEINTAGMVQGIYSITIRENNTGNVTTMQFVKQ